MRLTNRLKAKNTTREKLLECVTTAYNNYDVAILERIEGIQHEIYRQIMIDAGGNQFYMPHSGVRSRQKTVKIPAIEKSQNLYMIKLEQLILLQD
jgi:Mor family transcriptional regulator